MKCRRFLLVGFLFAVMLAGALQVGASTVDYIDYTEDFVDNSNDDNSPTHLGTHSVFADLQDYGANDDQMQEEDTGGGGGSVSLSNQYSAITGKKTTTSTLTGVVVASGESMYFFAHHSQKTSGGTKYATSVEWDDGGVDELFSLVGTGRIVLGKSVTELWYLASPTAKTATITVTWVDNNANWNGGVIGVMVLANVASNDGFESNTGGLSPIAMPVTTEVGDFTIAGGTIATTSSITESGDGTATWGTSDNGMAGGASYFTATDAQSDHAWTITAGSWTAVGCNLNPSGGGSNYELDLEIGWEAADYDESNEFLCIYPVTGGGWPAEDLKVDVWTGTWTNVFSDLTPDQWNNVSVGSYLTDATFEMRFLGGTESGDTTQDTWEIDAVMLTTYSLAYTEYINETIPLSDSTTVSQGAAITVNEVIPIYDTASVSAGFGVVVNELIGVYDSVVVAMDAVLTIFEQVGFTETVAVGASFVLTVLETIGLAVSVVVTKGVTTEFYITIFEVVGASDGIGTAVSASVAVFETIGTSEITQTAMSAYVTILETIGFTDLIAASRGLSVTVFETIGLSESTATAQLTHYYVYEVIGFIESTGVIGGVAATPTTGSMFYQLFFSLDMWGYLGPIALVVIGYLLTKKEKNLGIFVFIVESLVIAQYLALIEATPDYWWNVIILLLGNLLIIGQWISDR